MALEFGRKPEYPCRYRGHGTNTQMVWYALGTFLTILSLSNIYIETFILKTPKDSQLPALYPESMHEMPNITLQTMKIFKHCIITSKWINTKN